MQGPSPWQGCDPQVLTLETDKWILQHVCQFINYDGNSGSETSDS